MVKIQICAANNHQVGVFETSWPMTIYSSWWFQRQIGNLPQIGLKIKNIWNHHLVFELHFSKLWDLELTNLHLEALQLSRIYFCWCDFAQQCDDSMPSWFPPSVWSMCTKQMSLVSKDWKDEWTHTHREEHTHQKCILFPTMRAGSGWSAVKAVLDTSVVLVASSEEIHQLQKCSRPAKQIWADVF